MEPRRKRGAPPRSRRRRGLRERRLLPGGSWTPLRVPRGQSERPRPPASEEPRGGVGRSCGGRDQRPGSERDGLRSGGGRRLGGGARAGAPRRKSVQDAAQTHQHLLVRGVPTPQAQQLAVCRTRHAGAPSSVCDAVASRVEP